MFVMASMALLCTGGAMFSMRFLIALCQEREPRRFDYWVRRQLGSGTDTMAELQQSKKQVLRSA
jgi:hypothetical protein